VIDLDALATVGAPPAPHDRTLVVIPTLNEAANVATVLGRVRAAVPGASVLIVDDGSDDGTPELVESLAASLGRIRVARRDGPRGLGPAYRHGFATGLADGFDTLVEMDADLSHDPVDLPAILEALDAGADLSIGSRYVDGGLTVGWPKRREALSRVGGWYARRMLGCPVRDITSGFRAYRADLLRAIDLRSIRSTGYGFQIEMTNRAHRIGAAIAEVPIVFRERTAGASKMSAGIAIEAVAMVTRTAIRDRRDHRPSATGTLTVGGAS
jgi:glycosyltransferase involved in cell wall biosynthesis